MSMFERTRTGLREMPSNAAWLLSQALKPAEAVGDAAAGARDQGRKVTAAVVDAAPVGDSVEIRARRAHDAAEAPGRPRSEQSRPRGVQGACRPRARGERARSRSRQGNRPRDDPGGQAALAEAEKAAAEYVKRERQEAEADAEEQRLEVEEEVEDEIAEAEGDAEASQRRAEEPSRTRPRRWRSQGGRPTRPPGRALSRAGGEPPGLAAPERGGAESERRRGSREGRRRPARTGSGNREAHRARARSGDDGRRSGCLQEAGARRTRGQHRDRKQVEHDEGRARRRHHEGRSSAGETRSEVMRLLRTKAEPDRLLDTVGDSLRL